MSEWWMRRENQLEDSWGMTEVGLQLDSLNLLRDRLQPRYPGPPLTLALLLEVMSVIRQVVRTAEGAFSPLKERLQQTMKDSAALALSNLRIIPHWGPRDSGVRGMRAGSFAPAGWLRGAFLHDEWVSHNGDDAAPWKLIEGRIKRWGYLQ